MAAIAESPGSRVVTKLGVALLLLALPAACSHSSTTPSAALIGLGLDKSDTTLHTGETLEVVAIGKYADGSSSPITDFHGFSWFVDDDRVIPYFVSDSGALELTAGAPGWSSVDADYKGFSASLTVTVIHNLVTIEIKPQDHPVLLPDFSIRVQALAHYDDNGIEDVTTNAQWSVSDPNIGSVSPGGVDFELTNGPTTWQPFTDSIALTSGYQWMFSATSAGVANISATLEGATGTLSMTVPPVHKELHISQLFPPPNAGAYGSYIAIDGQGVATTVWGYTGSGDLLTSSNDGTGWTPSTKMQGGVRVPALLGHVKFAANAAGTRLFGYESDGVLYGMVAPPGQSFGAPQVVPTGTMPFELVAALVTDSGDPLLAWKPNSTYLSRYDSTTGTWSAGTAVGPPSEQIAFNSKGDAVAVGTAGTATTLDCTLWAYVYDHTSGALPKQDLHIEQNQCLPWKALAINDALDVAVAWSGQTMPRPSPLTMIPPPFAQAATYSPSAGWSSSAVLPVPTELGSSNLSAIVDPLGNATVVWVDPYSGNIWANRSDAMGGWQVAEQINTKMGLGTPQLHSLAADSNGNLIFFYDDGETTMQQFKYRRYLIGQGWTAPTQLLETASVGWTNSSLFAAYNSKGQGVMTWQETTEAFVPGGNGRTYLVLYSFSELAPPITP